MCSSDLDLSRIGHLIADLVEGESPADDDAAESLAAILTWEGLGAWLACNDGEEST